jgi:hypothetical protein
MKRVGGMTAMAISLGLTDILIKGVSWSATRLLARSRWLRRDLSISTLVHDLEVAETGDIVRSIRTAGIATQAKSAPSNTLTTAELVLNVLSLSNKVDAMGSSKIAADAQAVAQRSNPTRLVLENQYRLSRRCASRMSGMLESLGVSDGRMGANELQRKHLR